MTSQTRKQIIAIQIMPNISRNKDDKTKSKLSISMAQQSQMLYSLFYTIQVEVYQNVLKLTSTEGTDQLL